MSRHNNQYSPLPDEILRPHLEYAVQTLGLSNPKILTYMDGKYDKQRYSLSLATIKRRREEWQLHTSRKQSKNLNDTQLGEILESVRAEYPNYGPRTIAQHVRITRNIAIPRDRIYTWFRQFHPDDLQRRQRKKFVRKQFIAAGVNHIWSVDQHDKWKRFGLWLHVCVEPFSGKILWLKIWWTNSNPRLICGWFLDTVTEFGGVPLITQSDGGTENYGIANAQTSIRHHLDSLLAGTSQHRFKRNHTNIKPEIEWSLFRRYWIAGFETVMEQGYEENLYDSLNPIDELLWRWLAIPYFQQQLDIYRIRRNSVARRKDVNKVLPHGIPDLIFNEPEKFNSTDFKILVPIELIEAMRLRYAPPDHEVFQLVPPEFHTDAERVWATIESPEVTQLSLWTIFIAMKQIFTNNVTSILELPYNIRESGWNGGESDEIQLFEDLAPANLVQGIPQEIVAGYTDIDFLDDIDIFADITDNEVPDGVDGDYELSDDE